MVSQSAASSTKKRNFYLLALKTLMKNVQMGGCFEKCNEKMGCGVHTCKQRCHRKALLSHTWCSEMVDQTCDKQHSYRVLCSDQHNGCEKCQKEEQIRRKRVRRDLDMEKKRRQDQVNYKMELEAIKDEIAHHPCVHSNCWNTRLYSIRAGDITVQLLCVAYVSIRKRPGWQTVVVKLLPARQQFPTVPDCKV